MTEEMHHQHGFARVRLLQRRGQRRVRHFLGRVYQQSRRGLPVNPDRRAPARPVHQQIPQSYHQSLLWRQPRKLRRTTFRQERQRRQRLALRPNYQYQPPLAHKPNLAQSHS